MTMGTSAATAAPNTDVAIAFLDGLDPKGRHHLSAISPNGAIETEAFDPTERARMRDWINARQGRTNLYFSVNEAKPDAPRHNKLKKEHIGIIRGVFVDLDPKKVKDGDPSGEHFRRDRERLVSVVQDAAGHLSCPPTVAVDSGGGFQLGWQIRPTVTATPQNVELVEGITRTLLARFGGDVGTWNIDRVMRLPYTVNVLSPKKVTQGRKPATATVLLERSSGKTFTLEQLSAWAPPTPIGANSKGAKVNGSGKNNSQYPQVDMKAVQASKGYDDLPLDLRKSLEEWCSRDHVLGALWDNGMLPSGHADDSGSGYSFALAQHLKRTGEFTLTQFGQLLWIWPQSPERSKINARMIWRDWERAVAPVVGTSEGFEPVGGRGVPFAAPWGEPADLWAATSPPAELPQGVVPEIVERLARDGGRRLGVEPGALAAAYVTTFGSLVPAGNRLQMRQLDTDWTVGPTLWCVVVGDPATRKSPLLSYAARPVHRVEAQWRKEYAAAKHRVQVQSQNANATQKPGELGDGSNQSSDSIFQGDGVFQGVPTEVHCRQKVMNDATVEAIGGQLAKNPDGLLYFSDELSGWIGNMDAYKARTGKDRPFWLTAKEGQPYTINRQTRGRVDIPCCAVSVLGGIQPDKIRRLANDLDDDGLLQRFMPILIDQRGNGVDEAPDQGLKATADALALALAHSEPRRAFKFEPGAKAELPAVEDFVRRESGRPSAPPAMTQWLNKLPNEFGRIALVFHFIVHATRIGHSTAAMPELVSQETAQRARRFLTEFVFSHARTFYERVVGQSPVDMHARWVAGFILARGRDVIEARDIYRSYPPLKKQDRRGDIPAVMYDLEMLDWVKPFGPGRRGEPNKWGVNPAVHERFAERAAVEKAHRAEVREKITQAAAERRAAA